MLPAGAHAVLLTEVRAALAAGAAPGAALAAGVLRDRGAADAAAAGVDPRSTASCPPLVPLARAVRLGRSLADSAADVATGDPVLDLLVRALGVAERTGAGGVAAVDQALIAAADQAETTRRLRSRTAQARGTALVLTILPLAAWLGFVALDPALLGFYSTPVGALTGGLALALAAGGRWWSSRLVRRASTAAYAADPLAPRRPPLDVPRALSLALPAFLVVAFGAGVPAGTAVGGGLLLFGLRRPAAEGPPVDLSLGGASEAIELVAVALASGLSPTAAVWAVSALAPPAARGPLERGAQRLRGGWQPDDAFSDGGLSSLGAVLGASERWGAPAEPALHRLAAELRSTRRAAAEEAAERTQLALVFPTTLLTLPAFTVGVVPPMLWSAFTGAVS